MDQAYSRQSEDFPPVVTALAGVIRTDQVIGDPESCGVYSNDAYTTARQLPMCVVLPESTEDVVAIVNTCREFNTPLVTRGAGTGLSGGATPLPEAVLMVTSRMQHMGTPQGQRMWVGPGVRNQAIRDAVAPWASILRPT